MTLGPVIQHQASEQEAFGEEVDPDEVENAVSMAG